MNISFLIVLANITVPLPLQKKKCFRPDLNWRPSAYEADVITTTLRKPRQLHKVELLNMTYIYVLVHWY